MSSPITQQGLGEMMKETQCQLGAGEGLQAYSHGRARGTLETGEATVTLDASVSCYLSHPLSPMRPWGP